MSGFHAFPGGRHEVVDGPLGREVGAARTLDTARRTAVRETREEVGLELSPDRLVHLGTWRTPDYLVTPMATHFFQAWVDHETSERAQVDGQELVASAWRSAAEVLADWAAGRLLLAPPTRHLLTTLAAADTEPESFPARALAAAESRGVPPRFAPVRPDVTLFAMRTPTLPPATHTNCYVVGRERLVVVDPASPEAGEQAALVAHLEARCEAGARVTAVALTHAHHDHIAAAPVIAARFGVPIVVHPDARPDLPFAAEGLLADDAFVPYGDTPMQALHTPGHAAGHLVFWHAPTRTAICGDLVAGIGTILVDPDAGSMALYLDTLRRVRALEPAALLPAHGGVIGGAVEKLDEYIRHRLWREARIVDALRLGAADVDALIPRVYDDVAPAFWPIARLSLRAHLYKLREDSRAVETASGTWALLSDGAATH